MTEELGCRAAQIDAHFAGRLSPPDERRMRGHLGVCARCRRRYERHMLMAELDPGALDAHDRIGRGLGVLGRASPMRQAVVALLAAAAVVALVTALRPAPSPALGEFASRGVGRPAAGPSLEVYHSQPEQSFAPATGPIRRGDELAFAYTNEAGFPFLAVYGIDEHGHVYWYHPAWTMPAEDPESIRIEGGPRLRELPEAISQSLDSQELRIVAVFSSRPLHVREMERLLGSNGNARPTQESLAATLGPVQIVERTLRIEP
jgi:hypothetical protein